MNIDYSTIYHFDLSNQVQFGDMPKDTLYKLFQDGRVASKFLENYVPIWFPELKFVDADGYDHVDKATGKLKWDLKGFTKGGASYTPSIMIGGGRTIDEAKLHAHARTIDYIFSDVTEFPRLRLQFKSGKTMVAEFPSGKIKYNQKDLLFNGTKDVYENKK